MYIYFISTCSCNILFATSSSNNAYLSLASNKAALSATLFYAVQHFCQRLIFRINSLKVPSCNNNVRPILDILIDDAKKAENESENFHQYFGKDAQ